MMNFWKVSFFILLGTLIAGVAVVVYWINHSVDSAPLPPIQQTRNSPHAFTVLATKEDFEGIANQFLEKTIKDDPVPVRVEMENDVILLSEMTVFSFTLPVRMHFNPIVRDDGNVILKQSKMEVGQLNIPPATVLKILRDSVNLPKWMIVRPKEEELFIELTAIPVSGNLTVKAKKINLVEDEIVLEITLPVQ